MTPAQLSSSEFLRQSSLGTMFVSLAMLTPFSINNFVQGRYWLGLGSLAIVFIFSINAWLTTRLGRYQGGLLIALMPVILVFLAISIHQQGLIGVFWCYPAVVAVYFILPERYAWTANVALLAVSLPLAWVHVEQQAAIRLVVTLLLISVFSAIFIRVITAQQERLRQLATTDSLTGLLNRTLLAGSLQAAADRSKRSGTPMSLVMIDIDHFKAVNDRHGHVVGDEVLREIGTFLQGRVREADKVFRFGGEEFLLLLHDAMAAKGCDVAEQLAKSIEQMQLACGSVTVSAGVAMLRPGEQWTRWLKRSDENLYRAKAAGRNRVVG